MGARIRRAFVNVSAQAPFLRTCVKPETGGENSRSMSTAKPPETTSGRSEVAGLIRRALTAVTPGSAAKTMTVRSTHTSPRQ
jgi:hypothetical protein